MANSVCPCGAIIYARTNKSGKCVSCAAKTRAPGTPRPSNLTCMDCGDRIGPQSTSGRCRKCGMAYYNRLPETRAKRIEGWKKRLARPGEYEKLCKVATRNSQKAMADPVKRAAAAERARTVLIPYMSSPEILAKIKASRAAAGEKVREYRLGWCPQEYRALHHENVNRHRMKSDQSREMIEKMIRESEALKHVDDALCFLRKFAPVAKLEHGFRYGNAILGPAEVIERAKVRGWQPDRWAA
jgi:hypothetical protein